MTDSNPAAVNVTEREVLAELSGMIVAMLEDEGGVVDTEIGMDTRFTADLEMESIDLVALSTLLQDRYGERVNFAEFVAEFELDEILGLRVGQLVEYVTRVLAAPAGR